MSQHVQVTLICDMPLHETATLADRTMSLGIDGRHYELEVCAKHELQLLQTLGRYTMAARRVTSAGVRRNNLRTSQDRQHSREVRAWALASGRQLPERGRIPLAVLRDYAAAHALESPGASL
jgi:nucleoid-associated protein Lsr2